MARYIALFDKDDHAFGAIVPDCPGCTAMGTTFDEAHENAVTALHEWAAERVASGMKLPSPRRYEDLRMDPALSDEFGPDTVAVMMSVYPAGDHPVRVNVSMEARLVAAIDVSAKAHGLTRSGFLASAAREKIEASR